MKLILSSTDLTKLLSCSGIFGLDTLYRGTISIPLHRIRPL